MALNRRKSFSVLVIPDDGSRTREFKVSALAVKMAFVLILIGLTLSLFGGVSALQLRGWGEAVENLQVENARLRAEAEKVQKLSQALERLKDTDQQIRTMLSNSVPLNEAPYDIGGPVTEPAESSAVKPSQASTAAPEGTSRRSR